MNQPKASPRPWAHDSIAMGVPKSAPSKKALILSKLLARGRAGVTNLELNEICFRYGGRIFDLRKEGWDIETKQESESLFRFILHAEPKQEHLFPPREVHARFEESR